MFRKIPERTFKEIQTGAGMVLTKFDPTAPEEPEDDDILCTTSGGISASATPTFSDYGEDIDNCPNNMKELKTLENWECKMSFTALEFSKKFTKTALGAAIIKGDAVKLKAALDEMDFQDIWWVGETAKKDGVCAVLLRNALSTNGMSIQSTKDGKGQISVEFTGHVSITAQNVMPMEFYFAEIPSESSGELEGES